MHPVLQKSAQGPLQQDLLSGRKAVRREAGLTALSPQGICGQADPPLQILAFQEGSPQLAECILLFFPECNFVKYAHFSPYLYRLKINSGHFSAQYTAALLGYTSIFPFLTCSIKNSALISRSVISLKDSTVSS